MSITDLGLELYRKMYLSRSAEEAIGRDYATDVMKTPMHMSMGGEAIAAGVCHALRPHDQIVGTYRSHAIYLSRTLETDLFFAEMYGKATGMARGKAGSMHLSAPDAGLICTSAVVATGLPVGVGAAFANRRLKNQRVVAIFFGDGAVDEGVFWESLNAASLWRLPVLFVYEDNGFAVHSHRTSRHGYDSLAEIVSRFRCRVFQDETTDVEKIHGLASQAIDAIVTDQRPAFLGLRYCRYLEHVGVNEDFHAGYRDRAECDRWKALDAIVLQRQRLIDRGLREAVEQMEADILAQVCRSVEQAQNAPFPDADDIFQDLLA